MSTKPHEMECKAMDHFIAFWNLENLFAPEGYPNREPWIAQRLGCRSEWVDTGTFRYQDRPANINNPADEWQPRP